MNLNFLLKLSFLFVIEGLCTDADFCSLPRDEGYSDCGYGVRPGSWRWYFDKETYTCGVTLFYKGCGGNDNNFHFREDCEKACNKVIPGDPPGGACVAPAPNCTGKPGIKGEDWKFDPDTRKCFKRPRHCYSQTDMTSENECMTRCFKKRKTDLCEVTVTEAGCGRKYSGKYFYNPTKNECEQIQRGYCTSIFNAEMWVDKKECEKLCKK